MVMPVMTTSSNSINDLNRRLYAAEKGEEQLMYSKLTQHPEKFWKGFLLMPILLFSLAHCTNGNQEPTGRITETAITQSAGSNTQQNHQGYAEQEISQNSNRDLISQPTAPTMPVDSPKVAHTQPCERPSIDTKIEIDVSEQQLHLYCHYGNNQKEVKTYSVSTSKSGIGSRAGSNKTPLGQHVIEQKIGDGASLGTIFKARRNTGRIATLNAPGAGDLVTTRIMWLRGLEPGKNSGSGIDSYRRYIYIHGTAEENKIGQPASHGCVRMYNRDVIDLFDRVTEGTEVYIKK